MDVYIDFLGLAATAGKLATEQEEEHGSNDDQKNYKYRHYCSAAATTITISHEIDPPLCTEDSVFVGDLIVPGDWPGELRVGGTKEELRRAKLKIKVRE